MTWSLHYPFLARFSCTTGNKYSTGLYSIRSPLFSRVVRLTADCQQLSATAEDCTENSGQTRGAQGEPPSTADSEDVTHTLWCLIKPLIPSSPFPLFFYHSREKACKAKTAIMLCLSPLVIVVDFDRCPQKHCSICAPFWRNGLRILIDLGWWEPSSIQTIGQRYHNTAGSGSIA